MTLLRLCAAFLVWGVLSSCAASGEATSTPDVVSPGGESTWRTTTPGPLSPRHGVAAAWTGTEVILVGGDTQRPCPPNADCAYPTRPSAEAAAYDPVADSWRVLPDAPVPLTDGVAWWTGEEVIVVGEGHTLSLDPAASVWRRLEPSPEVGAFAVPAKDGLVFVSYEQQGEKRPVDWMLDTGTGRWSTLPRDPFGESYDRSMAWDGDRLWLLSMAVENHFRAYEGASSRLAVLDHGQWRVVEAKTPPVTYEQRLWWYDDRLIVGEGTYDGNGYAFDPSTQAWSKLPSTGPPTCAAPAAGPGPDWLSVGTNLIGGSVDNPIALPSCPALTGNDVEPDLAVWAGAELLLWGADFKRSTTTGLVWEPPSKE